MLPGVNLTAPLFSPPSVKWHNSKIQVLELWSQQNPFRERTETCMSQTHGSRKSGSALGVCCWVTLRHSDRGVPGKSNYPLHAGNSRGASKMWMHPVQGAPWDQDVYGSQGDCLLQPGSRSTAVAQRQPHRKSLPHVQRRPLSAPGLCLYPTAARVRVSLGTGPGETAVPKPLGGMTKHANSSFSPGLPTTCSQPKAGG